MQIRRSSPLPVLLAAVMCLGWATTINASGVELCREVAEVVLRPTKIVQKVRREGLKCLVVPFCCGPTWSAHGECYVVKEIEGTPERVELPKCSTQDINFALEQFIAQMKNPVFLFTPGIATAYKDLVELNYAFPASKPIPQWVASKLLRLVGKPGIPFDQSDISRSKWAQLNSLIDKPLRPETYRQEQDAITHGDLIIFSENKWKQALDGDTCTSIALWAHEVVHVFQNRRDGKEEFFRRYVSDARKNMYEAIPYEKEAYAVQNIILRDYCGILK